MDEAGLLGVGVLGGGGECDIQNFSGSQEGQEKEGFVGYCLWEKMSWSSQ